MNVAVYMGRSQPVAKSPVVLNALIIGAVAGASLCEQRRVKLKHATHLLSGVQIAAILAVPA